MGQFFTSLPVPAGVAFHAGPSLAVLTSMLRDVKINPPFILSRYPLQRFPGTLLISAAGKGGRSHGA